MKRSLPLLVKRFGMVVTATITATAISTGPAAAHTDITISSKYAGYFKFHDNGDVFEVCDTVTNGTGALGKLFYRSYMGDWHVTATADDGGDAGCDKFTRDIHSAGQYQMKLYNTTLPNHVLTTSRVFNE
ncbi:hypothetical protein [Streptomyces coelicoflavus]